MYSTHVCSFYICVRHVFLWRVTYIYCLCFLQNDTERQTQYNVYYAYILALKISRHVCRLVLHLKRMSPPKGNMLILPLNNFLCLWFLLFHIPPPFQFEHFQFCLLLGKLLLGFHWVFKFFTWCWLFLVMSVRNWEGRWRK